MQIFPKFREQILECISFSPRCMYNTSNKCTKVLDTLIFIIVTFSQNPYKKILLKKYKTNNKIQKKNKDGKDIKKVKHNVEKIIIK